MEVNYTGFTPTKLWLTDEVGTILDFYDSGISADSKTLYWDSPQASIRAQPLGLQVHSCPPTYNMTAMIRTYRGLYEDILAEVCCRARGVRGREQRGGARLAVHAGEGPARVAVDVELRAVRAALEQQRHHRLVAAHRGQVERGLAARDGRAEGHDDVVVPRLRLAAQAQQRAREVQQPRVRRVV